MLYTQKKKKLKDLMRKLDKTGSTDRTSTSGRPCSSRTHENENFSSKRSLVSLNKAIEQWLREFCWSFLLKEDMLRNMVCTKPAFRCPCPIFFSAGHVRHNDRSCSQTIFYTCLFVWLHNCRIRKKDVCIFLEFFKGNKRVCVFCIVREIALHVLSLECFCSKKMETL